MKKLVILLFFIFSISCNVFCQGIQFFHGTFQEALDLASKEGKLIFMDAYTTWCGPCKRMAAQVFPDPMAGNFYNPAFINMKVDMEKEEGPKLAQRFSVQAYPTLLFIDPSGNVVHRASGGRQVEDFVNLGKEALGKYDKSGDFARLYNQGDRNPELVLNYIKALNQAGKPSLKITNDFLLSQKTINTPSNMEIVFYGATDADSKVFDYLVQYKNELIKLKTKEVYETKIISCCKRTVAKAVEFRNEKLLKDAQSKSKLVPEKSTSFIVDSEILYYGATNNPTKYLKAAKTYIGKIEKKDPEKISGLGSRATLLFPENKDALKFSELCAKKAMTLSSSISYTINYATVLIQNGKRDEAMKMAKKALEMAKLKNESTAIIEKLIQEIPTMKI